MGKRCSFFAGAVAGALLAGAATLFLAPKSGKDIRKELEKIANDFTDPEADRKELLVKYHEKALKGAKKQAEKVQEKALETKDFVIERAQASKDTLKSKITPEEEGESGFEDIIINAKEEVADKADEVADVVAEKAQEFQENAQETAENVVEQVQEQTDNFI